MAVQQVLDDGDVGEAGKELVGVVVIHRLGGTEAADPLLLRLLDLRLNLHIECTLKWI